jgi:hypothetical protein
MFWITVILGPQILIIVTRHGQQQSGKKRVCFRAVQQLPLCRLHGASTWIVGSVWGQSFMS